MNRKEVERWKEHFKVLSNERLEKNIRLFASDHDETSTVSCENCDTCQALRELLEERKVSVS